MGTVERPASSPPATPVADPHVAGQRDAGHYGDRQEAPASSPVMPATAGLWGSRPVPAPGAGRVRPVPATATGRVGSRGTGTGCIPHQRYQ
jgi:hypothetical protein